MSRFHTVPYEDQSELELSPMLDVVFIMLIFFVVTASFVDELGLAVALPPTSELPPESVASISVTVEPNSLFLVNGHILSPDGVRPYVQALHGENPDADYIVILAPGSVVKDAAVAIDTGRSIGLDVDPITANE